MRRVLLLSGGFDSVAALIEMRPDLAVGFSYGQPHRDAELTAAGIIAARRGVPFEVLMLPDLRALNPDPGRDSAGISRAFVPGRNALFLTRAAARYAWPLEDLHLVMGATADDYAAFPDCRPAFFEAAWRMLRASLIGVCDVVLETPWLQMTKAQVLARFDDDPDALRDLRESVSCYLGTRCGKCDPCTLRARAFAACGLEDGDSVPTMHGGDPHRDARLKP